MSPASRLPLFDLAPDAQSAWLAARLAKPAPQSAIGLSDGFRLPGREGPPIPAAVLVPLVNRAHGLQLLLTQRSATLPDHPGQISFPGGRVEASDADHAAAALRCELLRVRTRLAADQRSPTWCCSALLST